MKYNFERLNNKDSKHIEAAKLVSSWSHELDSMLAYDLEAIQNHLYAIFAFGETGELLGHIAVVEFDKKPKKARIGAFAVAQEHQGNGVGGALINEIIRVFPEQLANVSEVYAFANEQSQANFVARGFIVTGNRLPPAPTGCNTVVSLHLSEG